MYTVCSLDNTNFCMLVEEQMLVNGKKIAVSVDIVLSSPPYSLRRPQDNEYSTHDMFVSVEIKAKSKVCTGMLQDGSHESLFCFVLPLEPGYKVVSKK